MAEQISLDMALFQTALGASDLAATVDADAAEARELGVVARPYILINGTLFTALPRSRT